MMWKLFKSVAEFDSKMRAVGRLFSGPPRPRPLRETLDIAARYPVLVSELDPLVRKFGADSASLMAHIALERGITLGEARDLVLVATS